MSNFEKFQLNYNNVEMIILLVRDLYHNDTLWSLVKPILNYYNDNPNRYIGSPLSKVLAYENINKYYRYFQELGFERFMENEFTDAIDMRYSLDIVGYMTDDYYKLQDLLRQIRKITKSFAAPVDASRFYDGEDLDMFNELEEIFDALGQILFEYDEETGFLKVR
jgi:hypothetical protein